MVPDVRYLSMMRLNSFVRSSSSILEAVKCVPQMFCVALVLRMEFIRKSYKLLSRLTHFTHTFAHRLLYAGLFNFSFTELMPVSVFVSHVIE